MAEDPRFLLHFKTLAKFKEKLADGTVNPDRHLVVIKDLDLVWIRGKMYVDNGRLKNLSSYYNNWEITQSNASTATITLKGKEWEWTEYDSASNPLKGRWKDISKALTLNAATSAVAGLMSAEDKRLVDIIDTANFKLEDPTYSATEVIINASHTDVNGETKNLKTSKSLSRASADNAGIMAAADYTQIYTTLPNSITNAINALDSNKTSTDGTNVLVKVTETDGKISAVNITTDNTINRGNIKAGTGISLTLNSSDRDTTINHSNSVTAVTTYLGTSDTAGGTAGEVSVISGVKYDALGHITGVQSKKITLNNTTYSTATTSALGLVKSSVTGTTSGRDYNVEVITDGTMKVNVPWINTTYSDATQSAAGLMSKDDKKKLDGIASSANNYSLPTATSSVLGGVKSSATGTTSNRDYNVEVNTDGTMKANVPWVDTKVTSAANHYTPTAVESSKLTATATGATAAWSIDVVKGIEIKRDDKGHVTDVSVTSGKIPANPNTDTLADWNETTTTSAAYIKNKPTIPTIPSTVSKTAAGLCPKLPNEEATTKFLRQDGSWAAPPDDNTTYSTVSKTAEGLCPQLPNEDATTKYLRLDGTWVTPPNDNTTYSAATSSALGLVKSQATGTTENRDYKVEVATDGTMKVNVPWINTTYNAVSKTAAGLCPSLPDEAATTKYLRQDGSWVTPPTVSTTAAGYMSTTDKGNLDFLFGNNTATSVASVPITKQLVIISISANGTFSLADTPAAGREVYCIINNTSSSERTITIPNSGSYKSAIGTSLKIKANSFGEISVISDGTTMYVRGA